MRLVTYDISGVLIFFGLVYQRKLGSDWYLVFDQALAVIKRYEE